MSNAKTTGLPLLPWGCLLSLILAGCAKPMVPQTETYGKIVGELKQANEQNRKQEANTPAINEALLPPLQIEAPRSAKSPEPRFDLSVNAAPAAQVFMAIVDGTRYSMLLPPDLSGTITLNLKDVTIRQALDTLRDVYGYDYKLQGTRISVLNNSMQTRLFQVSYLASKRGGTSSTRVSSSGGPPSNSGAAAAGVTAQQNVGTVNPGQSIDSANVFTGVVNDFWFDLSQAVGTVLGCEYTLPAVGGSQTSSTAMVGQAMGQRLDKLKCPDGRSFFLNAQSGVVMVRAMPNELREITHLLKTMQASIERQVMLEAKIIDVQLNDEFKTGINWADFNKNGGHRWSMNGSTDNYAFPSGRPPVVRDDTTGAILYDSGTLTGATGIIKSFPVAGALGLAFQTSNFASLINFLQTQGTVYVMSSPRIATINNQKAVIKVGSDDYYITSVTPGSVTAAATGGAPVTNPPSISAQPFFSGISLDVTPQIDDSGSITLHIRPSITDVSEKDKVISLGGLNYTLPYASIKVKESDSIVRVRDGMIVAIGGMMTEGQSDNSNKVPGVGDVPVAGHLFKQTGRSMNKRELVILLKPTLIQEDADWRQDLADVEGRMQGYDPKKFPKSPDIFKQ